VEKKDIHVLMKIEQTFYLAMGLPQELYERFPIMVRPSHVALWQSVLKAERVPNGEFANYFYCELETKPKLRVKTMLGKPTTVLATHENGGQVWHYCEKPALQEVMVMPPIVEQTWLASQFKERERLSLLQEGEKLPAVEWPFTLRTFKRQVQHVLDMLPAQSKVVVPSDPLGIMRHFWTGPLFVGSDKEVKKTLYLENDENNVLLLLDTYKDFTEGEKAIVQMWRGPIFVISCGNPEPFPGLLHLAPGIHAMLTATKSVPISWKQQLALRSELRDPESLLHEKGIKAMSSSPSVQYWRSMRPYSEWQHMQARPLAHDIHELACIWKEQGQIPVFFAYVGGEVGLPTPVLEGVYQVLYLKTVYSIQEDHPMVNLVMQNSHYVHFGKLYIFVPIETGTWLFATRSQGILDHIMLCGSVNSTIQVSSTLGLRTWDISHSYHRWLVVTYFTAWPAVSWSLFLERESRRIPIFKLQDMIQGFSPRLEVSPFYWRGSLGVSMCNRLEGALTELRDDQQSPSFRFWDAMGLSPPVNW